MYVDDFLSHVGLEGAFDLEELGAPLMANASYSQRSLDIALRVNELFDRKRQRSAFRKFLKKQFPVKKYGRSVVFSDEQRGKLLEIYKEDNEKLFANYMPEFPADSYSSIEATGRLGPLFEEMKTADKDI